MTETPGQQCVRECRHVFIVETALDGRVSQRGACAACIDALVRRERADVLREVAVERCAACREGIPFVTNEYGVLRPRGHVRKGYCDADYLHERARAAEEEKG